MQEPEDIIINTKQLRAVLKQVIDGVSRGRRYTVLYRSCPAFRIVPVEGADRGAHMSLDNDPLYKAGALGCSDSGDLASRHDEILYEP